MSKCGSLENVDLFDDLTKGEQKHFIMAFQPPPKVENSPKSTKSSTKAKKKPAKKAKANKKKKAAAKKKAELLVSQVEEEVKQSYEMARRL